MTNLKPGQFIFIPPDSKKGVASGWYDHTSTMLTAAPVGGSCIWTYHKASNSWSAPICNCAGGYVQSAAPGTGGDMDDGTKVTTHCVSSGS